MYLCTCLDVQVIIIFFIRVSANQHQDLSICADAQRLRWQQKRHRQPNMANCCATVYIIHGYSSTLCHGNNLRKKNKWINLDKWIHSLDCLGWVSADTLLAVHRLQPIPLETYTCNCSFPQNHWMNKYYLILPHEAIDSETVLVYHISVLSAVFDTMANLWILPLHKVSLYAKTFIKTPVRGIKIRKHWDIKVTFSSLYCCVFCTYVLLRNFSGFGLQWNLDAAFIGSIDYNVHISQSFAFKTFHPPWLHW